MRGDSMSKRYYYNSPIKALYMMREFGVKYDFENEEGLIQIIKTPKIKRDNFMRKIYINKESEHIFEPKNYDLAGFTRDDGISTVAQYDEAKKAFINGNFRILKKYNPKIIMRDNKQFFMPEVEND
jgi:hypothetical protein